MEVLCVYRSFISWKWNEMFLNLNPKLKIYNKINLMYKAVTVNERKNIVLIIIKQSSQLLGSNFKIWIFSSKKRWCTTVVPLAIFFFFCESSLFPFLPSPLLQVPCDSLHHSIPSPSLLLCKILGFPIMLILSSGFWVSCSETKAAAVTNINKY